MGLACRSVVYSNRARWGAGLSLVDLFGLMAGQFQGLGGERRPDHQSALGATTRLARGSRQGPGGPTGSGLGEHTPCAQTPLLLPVRCWVLGLWSAWAMSRPPFTHTLPFSFALCHCVQDAFQRSTLLIEGGSTGAVLCGHKGMAEVCPPPSCSRRVPSC